MINFSIIIPHKNSPELLQRCLASIPQREDIQIIIVDDNSESSIVNFCSFPGTERKDTEIIYSKESKGAGYARNRGLSRAKGEWILFADADDYYTNEFNEFLNLYKENKSDCIYFKIDTSERKEAEYLNINVNEFLNNQDANTIRYKSYTPWCKMTKRVLIEKEHILFDETMTANDVFFSIKVGYHAKSITATNSIIYHYSYLDNSLVSVRSISNLKTRAKVIIHTNNFMVRHQLLNYRITGISYFFQQIKRQSLIQFISIFFYYILHCHPAVIQKDLKSFISKH